MRGLSINNSDSSHQRSLPYHNESYMARNKKVFKQKSMQKMILLDIFHGLNIKGINLTKFSIGIENIINKLFHFFPALLRDKIFLRTS